MCCVQRYTINSLYKRVPSTLVNIIMIVQIKCFSFINYLKNVVIFNKINTKY